MKRTTKRILILMLCTVLIFTSAHSIYSNTFIPEVQAAEVVITAEIGAAVIEYLFSLLVSMGLIATVGTWFERAEQVNSVMDALAAYPEITADMTIAVTVNGKELELTYDQYMTYIKNNVVDGTGAAQVNNEVFTVLSGGGGKNGGDKQHQVELLANGAGQFLIYKLLMTAEQLRQSSVYEPTDSELTAINAAYAELAPDCTITNPNSNTVCIESTNSRTGNYNGILNYDFDIQKNYNGTLMQNASVPQYRMFLGAYTPNADTLKSSYASTSVMFELNVQDQHYFPVVVLMPFNMTETANGIVYTTSTSYVSYVVQFHSTGTHNADAYNGFDFDSWNYGHVSGQTKGWGYKPLGSVQPVGKYDNGLASTGLGTRTTIGLGRQGIYFLNLLSEYFSNQYTKVDGETQWFFGGITDIAVDVRSVQGSTPPLLIVHSEDELKAICDGLLENWDNNVFANYSGRTEPLFTPNALSQVSKPALDEFAKALLHGGISTDAAIDAATEIDGLREIEPLRLPEFYPDLYPEYLPEADPAEYPEIYPDYDPVTNPNPAPAIPPNPDRVVDNVTETVTNPNPNPTPNPGEETGGELDNADLEGATFSLSEYFPFCVPFDLIRAFKLLTAEAEAPYWEIPFHVEFLGYTIDYTFVIDMSKFEVLAEIFRLCETIGFCVGLILLTRNIIRG